MEREITVTLSPEQIRAIKNIVSLASAHHSGAFSDDVELIESWIAKEIHKTK